MADGVRVTFAPSGAAAVIAPGETLLSAARLAGVLLSAPCGGRGACGRCAVTVESGQLAAPSEDESKALARASVDLGCVRLACMARVESPVTVRPTVSPTRHPATDTDAVATGDRLVAAVDLGTTTVGVLLADPAGGRHLGSARVSNRQTTFGSDILSRIAAAMTGNAEELRAATVSSTLEALDSAAGASGISDVYLERMVIAGNTAMVSLLLGADVSGLGSHPFHHSLGYASSTEAGPLHEALPDTEILIVPPVVAFVGGDLIAGLVAEGLADGASGVIYMDLGTNAEVAAFEGESMVATSAPAGPAFEGWGIACGGPAGLGAVVRIVADDTGVMRPVTESGSPTHLTGSGLISALAVLHRLGHLRADGALMPDGPASDRFFTSEGVLGVSLSPRPLDRSLFITQLDVRGLQSAKAAVQVATEKVVRAAGMDGRDLNEVMVSGAFGGALNPEELVTLGILPVQASGLVKMAGEAALEGAAAIALYPDLMEDAARLARRVRHLDLALGETFAEEFVRGTSFETYRL